MATALVRFCVIALAAASDPQPPVGELVRIINQNLDTDVSYLTGTGPDKPLVLGQDGSDPNAWWTLEKVDGCNDVDNGVYPCYNIINYALRHWGEHGQMVSCCTSGDHHLDLYAKDDQSGNQRFIFVDYTGGPDGWTIRLSSKSRFYQKNNALLSSGHHGEYVDLSYLHSGDENTNAIKWQYWKIERVSPPSPHPSIEVIPDCTIGGPFGWCTPEKMTQCHDTNCCGAGGYTCPDYKGDKSPNCQKKKYTCKPPTADSAETAKDGNEPRTMFP